MPETHAVLWPPRPAAERRAPGEPYGTVPGTCHRRVHVGPTSVTGSNGRTGIPRRVPCLRVERFSSGCTSQSVGIRDIRPLARTNRGRDASGRLDELRRPAHGAGGAMRGGYAVRARSGHGVVASEPSRVVRTPALRRSAAASLYMAKEVLAGQRDRVSVGVAGALKVFEILPGYRGCSRLDTVTSGYMSMAGPRSERIVFRPDVLCGSERFKISDH